MCAGPNSSGVNFGYLVKVLLAWFLHCKFIILVSVISR